MHDDTFICIKSVGPKFINSVVLAIFQNVVGVLQVKIAIAKSDRFSDFLICVCCELIHGAFNLTPVIALTDPFVGAIEP